MIFKNEVYVGNTHSTIAKTQKILATFFPTPYPIYQNAKKWLKNA